MTIPTPNQFKGDKVVKEEVQVIQAEQVAVHASQLGDGKIDAEDIKKVYLFASTNKQLIAAIILAVAAFASGKGADVAFQYLGLNTPSVEVQKDVDAVNARMKKIEDKINILIKVSAEPPVEAPVIPVDRPAAIDEASNVPFTATQDSTTDDGTSLIKSKTTFSVQSTETN